MRYAFGVLLDGELGKDIFKPRERHQVAELLDRIVRHHPPFVQNHDPRRHALHRVQFVRAEQNDFSARR
jgi:hypothetical protein